MAGEILGSHGSRYELMEPIGQGSAATIWRARDRRIDRLVAIKVLREGYKTERKNITRFQMEARAQSSLTHPNIVQVYDYGQSASNYFIVMELIQGIDLGRYLQIHHILDVDQAVAIAHDVALGLGAAHRRSIVHRDIKPQNIMVNGEGLVKLTDFGIASMYKSLYAERLTTTGAIVGPVHYLAPEQAQGKIVSPAADVYALGIVLYEMLTGKRPFDGGTPVSVALRHIEELPEPPRKQNPKIPPGLEALILRCLEKDPRDRYANGDELAKALDNYEDEADKTGPYEYGPRNVVQAGAPRRLVSPPLPPPEPEEEDDEEWIDIFTARPIRGAPPNTTPRPPVTNEPKRHPWWSRDKGASPPRQEAQAALPPVSAPSATPAPAPQKPRPRVFVSHSHKNDNFTARFVADLRAAGVEVWVDMTNIRSGDFVGHISEGLRTCEWLILVLTPEALASEFVPWEVNIGVAMAVQKEIKGVIPFMVHPCDPQTIPPAWKTLHRYDATSDYQSALAGLLRALGVE